MIEQEKDDIICDCTGTSYQKVQLLLDNGATSLDEISDATGACTGCGSCDILVIEMVEQHQKQLAKL
ncbi:MAG: (2Fe-2S)-binding protein [Gammaproteobacteria bacterium]|nr:MAG: (2Fe-2S)-binding protein [Gammaproteobacteria bacterium]